MRSGTVFVLAWHVGAPILLIWIGEQRLQWWRLRIRTNNLVLRNASGYLKPITMPRTCKEAMHQSTPREVEEAAVVASGFRPVQRVVGGSKTVPCFRLEFYWKFTANSVIFSGIAPTTVPEMSDENLSQLLEYIPLKHLYIVMQKPKIVLLPPNHASMPPGLTMGKPFTMVRWVAPLKLLWNSSYFYQRKDELLSKESGCVILQTERIEFHQSAPFYPGRLMKTAASANGLVDEALQHCCYIHLSVSVSLFWCLPATGCEVCECSHFSQFLSSSKLENCASAKISEHSRW